MSVRLVLHTWLSGLVCVFPFPSTSSLCLVLSLLPRTMVDSWGQADLNEETEAAQREERGSSLQPHITAAAGGAGQGRTALPCEVAALGSLHHRPSLHETLPAGLRAITALNGTDMCLPSSSLAPFPGKSVGFDALPSFWGMLHGGIRGAVRSAMGFSFPPLALPCF